MTLEEIFQTNLDLLNEPEVQKLIAHVQEQQKHNYLVHESHMKFRNTVEDIVFASDQFALSGADSASTIIKLIEIL